MSQARQPGHRRFDAYPESEEPWAGDLLDRHRYAERLTILIQNTPGPYVIGLTSPWGSGKTFFLTEWRKHLLAGKKPCFYFNAWEYDFAGDPLASVMASLKSQFSALSEQGILPKDALLPVEALVESIPGLLQWGAKFAKAAGQGSVGLGLEAGSKLMEKAATYVSGRGNFKKNLEKCAKKVRDNCSSFPLFIMVDELDRCRPDYAITLLERIKHLFQVPGVVFLLAVDPSQLLLQVEHTFGLKCKPWEGTEIHLGDIDPRMDYLGKFFDVYYSLPPPDVRSFVTMKLKESAGLALYTKKFSHYSFLKSGLVEVLASDVTSFQNKSLRLILQDIERFSVLLRAYPDLSFEEVYLAFTIIMASKNRIFGAHHLAAVLRKQTLELADRAEALYQKTQEPVNFNNPSSRAEMSKAEEELVRLGFGDKAFCASFLIRMLMISGKPPHDRSFIPLIGGCVKTDSGIVFMGTINYCCGFENLTPIDEVEAGLQAKLQLLQDFSSTPNQEGAS